jgi:hypothetical protein
MRNYLMLYHLNFIIRTLQKDEQHDGAVKYENSHCTFITISLELITRNNNKMKKENFSFTHFHNFETYDQCLRKTILDLKPAILWDNFMEAGVLFRYVFYLIEIL